MNEEPEVYDGHINVTDTVDREDIMLDIRLPITRDGKGHALDYKGMGTHRMAKALKYLPRKRMLVVSVRGLKKHFRVSENHVKCAYKTELPPKHNRPKKKDLLYDLKLMEMTKGDRDKLKVVWGDEK